MKIILDKIKTYPIIPVYYHDSIDESIRIMHLCYEGGIRVFEYVNRGEKSHENFQALLEYKKSNLPDLTLGIGTIKTAEDALKFIEYGTEFLVSPIIQKDISIVAASNDILWIPGCMTPTEIALAEQLICPLVKIFPAETLGPKYFKSIKPLFPKINFMPTGGINVDKDTIRSWISAGAYAIGLGSSLFSPTNEVDIIDKCKQSLEWVKQ